MFVEKRVYTVKPGGVPVYMKIYEEFGYTTQSKHLGQPVGWYFSEIGGLNKITHMWQYEDLNDRAARRAAMQADPDWHTYLGKIKEADILLAQENELLVPAPWSPELRDA